VNRGLSKNFQDSASLLSCCKIAIFTHRGGGLILGIFELEPLTGSSYSRSLGQWLS
jgi:hypothetical protein